MPCPRAQKQCKIHCFWPPYPFRRRKTFPPPLSGDCDPALFLLLGCRAKDAAPKTLIASRSRFQSEEGGKEKLERAWPPCPSLSESALPQLRPPAAQREKREGKWGREKELNKMGAGKGWRGMRQGRGRKPRGAWGREGKNAFEQPNVSKT